MDGMITQAESKERKISDGTEEIPVYRTMAERVAIHVAKTGEVLNIANVFSAGSEKCFQLQQMTTNGAEEEEEKGEGMRGKTTSTSLSALSGEQGVPELTDEGVEPITSILCVPIFNSADKVIGVAQVANKKNKRAFNSSDIKAFEAFALFCGLGIHNAMLYDKVLKLNLRQEVALEVLSYHTTATEDETKALLNAICDVNENKRLSDASEVAMATAPSLDFLVDFQFSDFELTDAETVKLAMMMFKDFKLDAKFKMTDRLLAHWMLSVKKNYRPVTYHNWRHAFNVAQTMFVIMKKERIRRAFDDLEVFLFLVACLCHDLDHRGQTNSFQQMVKSPLARLYSTSTLERHHFNHAVMILNSKDNNIFHSLSEWDYKTAITLLERLILATDLTLFFKKWGSFCQLLDSSRDGADIDWRKEHNKGLLSRMLMTACDVAAIMKPWEIQQKVARLVASEFFEQGDMERAAFNRKPSAQMDREREDELPKMQIDFIDAICLPLYQRLGNEFQELRPMQEGCLRNRNNWQALDHVSRSASKDEDEADESKTAEDKASGESA